MKQEGEGETELLADEDVEASGRVGEMDQSIEYIVFYLPRQLNYIKRKTGTVLGVGALMTSYKTAKRTLANLLGKHT